MIPVISTYQDTLLLIGSKLQQESVVDFHSHLLSSLKGGIYSSLVVFLLLCHAKDHISVKDNLELDSLELHTAQHLILNRLSPLETLQLVEDLIFLTTSIKLSEQSDQFSQSRINLFFEKEVNKQRQEISFFCQNRYVTSD